MVKTKHGSVDDYPEIPRIASYIPQVENRQTEFRRSVEHGRTTYYVHGEKL